MKRKRKIHMISTRKKDHSEMGRFRSYIGKKVISKSGDFVGRVYDVLFSGDKMTGIMVWRRFSKLFVGKEFFDLSEDAVMLSINPVTMLIGKKVFDADGKKIGTVKGIIRKGKTNNFDAVTVKKNIFSKSIKVPKSEIETSKKNIILKKVY